MWRSGHAWLAIALLLWIFAGTNAWMQQHCRSRARISFEEDFSRMKVLRRWAGGGGASGNEEDRKLYEGDEITGKSLILCGPSGAGKGAIMDELMERSPGTYELCVSHTSRSPRPGEINGTHYYFVSKGSMSEEIKKDEESSTADSSALTYQFLEYAEVHGNFYGTSASSVRAIHKKGLIAILDIDTLGVQGIHELDILPAKYVFVAPPSLEELENRLRNRGTETEDQIELRLRNAITQMEFGINSEIFDYILENDILEEAVDELSNKLLEWGMKPS